MLHDFSQEGLPDRKFEIVVVGAGAIGLPLAVKLARAGRSVLLIEAGPRAVSDNSQVIFRSASISGHSLPGAHLGRFRALGGTTNFWGGQLVKFDKAVFAARPWLNAPSWPISRDDLEPHYREAFKLLGMGEVLEDDSDVWSALSIPRPLFTEDVSPIFSRWVPQTNFATLFSSDIENNTNLVSVVNAQVTGFSIAPDGSLIGCIVSDGHGRSSTVRSDVVVLANGTLEISRLLLSTRAVSPWVNNRWLGVGFLDHVDCDAGKVHVLDKRRFLDIFENAALGGLKYASKLHIAPQAQMHHQIGDVAAHFVFNSSLADDINNLKIFGRGIMRGRLDPDTLRHPLQVLNSMRFALPMAMRYLRHKRVYSPMDGGITLRITAEQRPNIISRIALRDDRDPYDMPCIDVNWNIGSQDINTLAVAAELVANYLAHQGLASVDIDPILLSRDSEFLRTVDDANHHMGGARMSYSAAEGVVNENLRVHGSRNLYIAGAAVYPSSGFANPTFTGIALAMRLADHLNSRRTV